MRHILLFLSLTAVAAAQPVINPGGIANIASLAPDGLPNSGLALGSIFVVNGTGLGAPNPTPINFYQPAVYPLPTSQGLNGTTITLTAGGPLDQAIIGGVQPIYAIMLYESDTMLAAIIPSSMQPATYTITVTYNGQSSAPSSPVHVVQHAFGIFSAVQAIGSPGVGYGPGAILQLTPSGQFVNNTFTAPAQPGQTIVILGSGLGGVSYDESQGPGNGVVNGINALSLTVYIGGKIATSGPSGRYISSSGQAWAGVDFLEVQLPQTVSTGCYVSVAVSVTGVAGATSNTASMSIDPSGTSCSDPATGYTPADLQQIAADPQGARIGNITVTALETLTPSGVVRTDGASAAFSTLTTQQVNGLPPANPSPGSCMVLPFSANTPPAAIPGTPLDAGPAITFTSPDGLQQILQASGLLTYTGLSSTTPIADPGAFTVSNGAGGADIGPFQFNFNVPGAPQGIQATPSPILISFETAVGWTAVDPNSVVSIIAVSVDTATGLGAAVLCSAPPTPMAFQVPNFALSWLPTTSTSAGLLYIYTLGKTRFQAPGLDVGYFSYQVGYGVPVQFVSSIASKE